MERFDEHIHAEARALQRAYAVINFYTNILASVNLEQEGLENVVIDLVADLYHWCDKMGLDFTGLQDRATVHYEVEAGKRPEEGLEPTPNNTVGRRPRSVLRY